MPKKTNTDLSINDFDEVPDEMSPAQDVPEVDKGPSPTDPTWTEHVLSQMTEKELFKGVPKVNGLRRMVMKLLGPIVDEDVIIADSPNINNNGGASVSFKFGFIDPKIGMVRYFSGAAHSHLDNIQHPDIKKFTLAMSETRARGRAYRNALALDCSVAEEFFSPDDIYVESITESQLVAIDNICCKANVNAGKVVSQFAREMGVKRISEITKIHALKLVERLQKYQQGTTPPDEILGYKNNWLDAMKGN